MMARLSEEALVEANPERRSYVLTRSANVGTFKYSCATWTGDNETRSVSFSILNAQSDLIVGKRYKAPKQFSSIAACPSSSPPDPTWAVSADHYPRPSCLYGGSSSV